MKYQTNLIEATLLKRHSLFLADVIVAENEKYTIFCPNFITIPSCDILGSRIWLQKSMNSKYRYPYIWEISEVDSGNLVNVNINRVNSLVLEGIENSIITELSGYETVNWEDKQFNVDLVMQNHALDKVYISVQHLHCADELYRSFLPENFMLDSVQQLEILMRVKAAGKRAVLLCCAQNTGIKKIFLADHIDPNYTRTLRAALECGVELLIYKLSISTTQLEITTKCAIHISQKDLLR